MLPGRWEEAQVPRRGLGIQMGPEMSTTALREAGKSYSPPEILHPVILGYRQNQDVLRYAQPQGS